MPSDDDDAHSGWRDPIGIFLRLQTAAKIIAEGKNNFRERTDNATRTLVGLLPDDFPERIRRRAEKVLNVRLDVAQKYGRSTLFHFERLSPNQRRALIKDIFCLYEACLLDLGNMPDYREIVYPKDR
jgi:hypothetical protein